MDLLKRDIPLLIEKPLTVDVDRALDIVEIAESRGVPVCTNYTRRLFPNVRKVATTLQEGDLGELRSIHVAEGSDFDWPTTSGFYFERSGTPQGVLLDRGPHLLGVLDLWLDGDYEVSSFRDDAQGGTEAVAELRLEHERGTEIKLRLSWLNRLENRYRLKGTKGAVECEVHDWRNLSIERAGDKRDLVVGDDIHGFEAFVDQTVKNFLSVVSGEEDPITSASDVLGSVEAIQAAYEQREGFDLPWLTPRWSA
jgi:predicted dehydrogenase